MPLVPLIVVAVAVVGVLFALVTNPARASLAFAISLCLLALLALSLSSELRQAALLGGPFLLPFVVGAGVLGIASGTLLKTGRPMVAGLIFVPLVYWLWSADSKEEDKATILAGGLEFASSEPRLAKLAGENARPPSLASYTQGSDGTIRRLEYFIRSSRPAYALVDVSQERGQSKYKLACITSLSMGQREAFKDACLQSPIELPPLQ